MKIFLAGTGLLKDHPEELKKSKYCLESFYSIRDWQIPFFQQCDDFLLDSGAFTFMNSTKTKNVDFNEYLEKYADFINRFDIQHFFELDVDSIIGIDATKQLRNRLEKLTKKRCIPVWHKCRGIDAFKKMCDEYSYAAIGGLAIKDITKQQYAALPIMIKEAHIKGCRLHGLGFTSTSYFNKIHFDTVDSTTWNVGGKFGNICVFDERRYMRQKIDNSKICINRDALMLHNWNEWIKFQQYADKYL